MPFGCAHAPYDFKSFVSWKRFFIYHAIILLLFVSWFFPPTEYLWESLDIASFHFFNSILEESISMQIFWGLANVRITDLFGALFIVIFFLMYTFEEGRETAKLRLAQFLYLCIWGEIGILVAKEGVYCFLKWIGHLRHSPSLVLNCPVKISEMIPWLKVKDFSYSSFPGDHALIVLQWSAFVFFFCGMRYGFLALISSTFFILPRIMAGAHWMTDTLIGSTSCVLVIIAWATCTPIYPWLMPRLLRFTSRIVDYFSKTPCRELVK